MDYYLLFIWGRVEPELTGPFDTAEERDAEALKLKDKEGTSKHLYYKLNVPKGTTIELDSFTNEFFGE